MRVLIITAAMAVSGAALLGLGSCATMSEDQCLAGAWAERGYTDGTEGQATSRLDEHAEACAKYGVVPDETAYFSARDSGLQVYCTPQRGFRAGREGSTYAGVCPASLEPDFLGGYEDGRVVLQALQAVTSAQSSLDGYADRIRDLDDKLDAKDRELRAEGLTDEQRDDLRRRISEIRDERDDRIRDARRAERDLEDANDLARDVRYRFAYVYGAW